MSEHLFERVALIGLGQMGASLGLSLKAGGRVGSISGYDLHPDHSSTALSIEAIDVLAPTPAAAVEGADLVVLCTPVGTYGTLMQQIAPHLKAGCVLSDIGSIKSQAVKDILPHLPKNVSYVPSHPVAGSEKTGPYTARSDYFKNKLFLITPHAESFDPNLEVVGELWRSTGAVVDVLPTQAHDQIYAYMSHVPQLMAFAAMPVLDANGIRNLENDPIFSRFIRIGRSDPEMWRDVFMENAQNVLGAADAVAQVLTHIRNELEGGSKKDEEAPDPATFAVLVKSAWPRLLASSIIIAVNVAEQQMGQKLSRYAAGGFTDFTAPATAEEPQAHVELISNYSQVAVELLDEYLENHRSIMEYMLAENSEHLLAQLAVCQACGKRLTTTIH